MTIALNVIVAVVCVTYISIMVWSALALLRVKR